MGLAASKQVDEDADRVLVAGRPDFNRCDNMTTTSKYTVWTFLPVVRVAFTNLYWRHGQFRAPENPRVHQSLLETSVHGRQPWNGVYFSVFMASHPSCASGCIFALNKFLTLILYFFFATGNLRAVSSVRKHVLSHRWLHHGSRILFGRFV